MTLESFPIKNEILALTSFRFIAAFYVFLFHLEIRAPLFADSFIGSFMREGAVGMTMFFVLSGFILAYVYDLDEFDSKRFFLNRFARIYPIYIVAAILALPWLFLDISTAVGQTNLYFGIFSSIILLVFGVLMVQAWLPQSFSFWNNSASWSLSVEAFFYSIFPYINRKLRGTSLYLSIIGIVILSLTSAMISVSQFVFSNSPESFSLFYALPAYRLPEFISGILTYVIAKKIAPSRGVILVLVTFVVLGFSHVILFGKLLPTFMLHNWIFVPAVSSLILMFYFSSEIGWNILSNSLFVWLGKISYCFYSFQFHVLEGLRWILPSDQVGALEYGLLSFLILLSVSALAYHFIEEPSRVWIRNWSKRREVE